jgi:surface antigen
MRWLGAALAAAVALIATQVATSGTAFAAATGTVNTPGDTLHVRGGPGTGYSIVGSLPDKASVSIYCTNNGTNVQGQYGWTVIWDKISSTGNQFVSDAFVYTGTNNPVARPCDTDPSSTLNPYNYPWPTQDGWVGDGHGYFEGECVSFAAWAIRNDGMAHNKSPDFLHNADLWTGYVVDSGPRPGDVAQWDDNHNAAGPAGHVAYVAAVNSDGTIKIYEYNWGTFHRLNIRTISAGAPSRYLHF